MKVDCIKRRMFLQGAAGVSLGLPFLPSLVTRREAHAEPAEAGVRRFCALQSYNGQLCRHWYPRYEGGDYSLRSSLPPIGDGWIDAQKAQDHTTMLHEPVSPGAVTTHAPLQDFIDATGSISDILDESLNPLADKLLLLRGLDMMAETNHNAGALLGNPAGASINEEVAGRGYTVTVDQVLAWSSAFYRATPAMRSLHLSPAGAWVLEHGNATISYTNNGVPGAQVTRMNAFINPRTAWNAVFGLFDEDSDRGAFIAERNAKLVDRVYEDYASVRNGSRLGATDRATFERHMTFLSELESRLLRVGPTCVKPAMPADIEERQGVEPEQLTLVYELMVDLIAAAIMCDQTRVATLDIVKAVVPLASGDIGYRHDFTGPGSWHGDAHDIGRLEGPGDGLNWDAPGPRERLVALNRWIAGNVFGRLARALDVEENNGRTFLDNSVIYWGNEISAGSWHTSYSMPALLAGSGGGFLGTGRMLDFSDWANRPATFFYNKDDVAMIQGVPYNRLLVTVLQAMGLRPEDYETDGQPGFGSYELIGLSRNADEYKLNYDESAYGEPLPGIVA